MHDDTGSAATRSAVAGDLLAVLRLLVDQPAEVRVEERGGGGESTLFEAQLAPEDLGKVIGKQGRTIESLRTLLAARAGAGDEGQRYELEILED